MPILIVLQKSLKRTDISGNGKKSFFVILDTLMILHDDRNDIMMPGLLAR
jgi:hypothetical protein